MTEPEQDTPARRIFERRATPADLASFDQSRAEAAHDLRRLREAFTERADQFGSADAAHTAFVVGLLTQWTPLAVASVAVEAIRQMEDK